MAKRLNAKLAPRIFGPYMVKKKVGKVAYLLDLPPQSQIHPVFHVSQLKPARGYTVPSDIPPPVTDGMVLDATPAVLLAIRHPAPSQTEVLVQWNGLSQSEATWENYDKLLLAYPDSHLEDKVQLLTEGIVTTATKATKPAKTIVY